MKEDMKNLFEKSMLFGLGVFDASKETVEGFVDDMLSRGKIQKQEAENLRTELKAKREEEKVEMEQVFELKVTEALLSRLEIDSEYRAKVRALLEKE